MTTYGASLDYWSDGSTQPVSEHAENNVVDAMIKEDEIKEIVSLEDITFDKPPASYRFTDTHPRFLRFLLLNIIVVPILIYAAFLISGSHPPELVDEAMISSGAQAMSANNLVALVKSGNQLAYWINPVPGDTYANNSTKNGVDSISYIPAGAKTEDGSGVTTTINTYKDISVYNAELQPLAGAGEMTIPTATGVTVEYNVNTPNRMIVSFAHKPEIVVINYPSKQDVSTLLRDAENLVPIN